jgi:hypothetical protein
MPPLATIKQFCNRQPAFTEGAVRWHIFNEQTNGLAKTGAIIRLGRRVLVDEERFVAWVRSGAQSGLRAAPAQRKLKSHGR